MSKPEDSASCVCPALSPLLESFDQPFGMMIPYRVVGRDSHEVVSPTEYTSQMNNFFCFGLFGVDRVVLTL